MDPEQKIRVLIAKPGLDGHERGAHAVITLGGARYTGDNPAFKEESFMATITLKGNAIHTVGDLPGNEAKIVSAVKRVVEG